MTLYDFVKKSSGAIYKFLMSPIIRVSLGKCGRRVRFSKGRFYGIHNIDIGNNVSFGEGFRLFATRAKIIIGDDVMFAPGVTVVTGDHRTVILDRPMIAVPDCDKLPENDRDVVFEGDNWIAANAIILKGVTIGKGSVVSAGSVVVRNVPPYAIVGGIPAKVIRMRGEKHEQKSVHIEAGEIS